MRQTFSDRREGFANLSSSMEIQANASDLRFVDETM